MAERSKEERTDQKNRLDGLIKKHEDLIPTVTTTQVLICLMKTLSCFTDKQITVALVELGFDLLDRKSCRILLTMKINFAFIDLGLDEKLSCFITVRENNYRNYRLRLSCFTDHEHNYCLIMFRFTI